MTLAKWSPQLGVVLAKFPVFAGHYSPTVVGMGVPHSVVLSNAGVPVQVSESQQIFMEAASFLQANDQDEEATTYKSATNAEYFYHDRKTMEWRQLGIKQSWL